MLNIIPILTMIGYILLLTVAGVACFVLVVIRFYKSMASEEAYLTFTLPVKTSSLLLSKMIVGVIWEILSVIIIGISILLFTLMNGVWTFDKINVLWDRFIHFLASAGLSETQVLLTGLLYLVVLIIGTFCGLLQIYLAIAFGQTARSHRILCSFGFYMGIYTVLQILSMCLIIPLMVISDNVSGFNFQVITMVSSGILSIITGIAMYLITNFIFKKKLNLE